MKRPASILLSVLLVVFAASAGAQMRKLPKKVDRKHVRSYNYQMPVSPQMVTDYLLQHLVIPGVDTNKFIPGKMVAFFIIDTAGKIRYANVTMHDKGPNSSKVKRAIVHILKEAPPFKVAVIDDVKFPVRYSLPINIDWAK